MLPGELLQPGGAGAGGCMCTWCSHGMGWLLTQTQRASIEASEGLASMIIFSSSREARGVTGHSKSQCSETHHHADSALCWGRCLLLAAALHCSRQNMVS